MGNICEKFFVTLQLGESFIEKKWGLERFTFIFVLIQKRNNASTGSAQAKSRPQ